ncbi:hypothetical protein [Streptomyces sp. NPDC002044]|uniref:hypothetical protein n=1 Tax=Streptomyces sp. NPDC002044 TaxID=3154662 RepID=UPI0033268E8A
MTGADAYEVHVSMRQFGIPGAVTPVAADDPAGAWCVVDADGQTVTDHVLARVAAARAQQPARGFVTAR